MKAALNDTWLKTRTDEELEDKKEEDEEEFIDTFNSGLNKSKDAPLRDISVNRDNGANNSRNKSYKQPPKGNGLVVINADEVEPEETTWICQDVIPRGKLGLIAGNPGLGKSQLSTYFAATVTTGGKWPSAMGDIPNAETGTVIILQAEDHVKDTIVPRLMAAGADLTRVKIVQAVKTDTDSKRSFLLEIHLTD